MKTVFIFLLFIFSLKSFAGDSTKKIMDAPSWQVEIYYMNEMICKGSLLNSSTVLTSAHCLVETSNRLSYQRRNESFFLSKDMEGNEYKVVNNSIFINPQFNITTLSNEHAFFKIIPLGRTIQTNYPKLSSDKNLKSKNLYTTLYLKNAPVQHHSVLVSFTKNFHDNLFASIKSPYRLCKEVKSPSGLLRIGANSGSPLYTRKESEDEDFFEDTIYGIHTSSESCLKTSPYFFTLLSGSSLNYAEAMEKISLTKQ